MATAKAAKKNNIEQAMEIIESLTLLEMSELVKNLEEKFGVTAAAPMAAMPMMVGAPAEAAEEQTEFDVILKSFGSEKGPKVSGVKLLGSRAKVEFKQTAKQLTITLPPKAPCDYIHCFRIQTG